MSIEPLLTKQEVAKILKQSVPTVDRKLRSKEIRSIHLGTAVRVDPVDLRAYLDRNRSEEFVGESDGKLSISGVGSAEQPQVVND